MTDQTDNTPYMYLVIAFLWIVFRCYADRQRRISMATVEGGVGEVQRSFQSRVFKKRHMYDPVPRQELISRSLIIQRLGSNDEDEDTDENSSSDGSQSRSECELEEGRENENKENNEDEEDEETSIDEPSSWTSSIRLISDAISTGLGDLQTDPDEPSLKTCPICLDDYEIGDELCASRNKECNHTFHLECMTDWLMTHDDCPLCRADYLGMSTSSHGCTVASSVPASDPDEDDVIPNETRAEEA